MSLKNIGQNYEIYRLKNYIRLFLQRILIVIVLSALTYILLFSYSIGREHLDILFGLIFYSALYKLTAFLGLGFIPQNIILKFETYAHLNSFIYVDEMIIFKINAGIAILLYLLITYYFKHKGNDLALDKHNRGLKVVSKSELNTDIKNEIDSKSTGLKYTDKDFYIGKESIRVPRSVGANMWAYLGNSGTGKSIAIFNQLIQIRSYGEKVIIVDPSGEYYKLFGKKDDVILSLYDTRSEFYSFWEEGVSSMRIAQSLIEDSNGGNEFWSKAAQALFAGLLDLNTNSKDMYEMLFLDYEILKNKLKESASPAGIVLGEAEQAGSVLSSAAVDLVWLRDMNYWPIQNKKTEKFSIKKWVNNNSDKRWIFLTSSDSHFSASRYLIRLWTDLAVLSCFERGVSKDNIPIWLICDELSSIGKLPSMSLLEDRGRKYQMGLIAGFQSPSQIEAIYGQYLARSIMQGLQNQVLFRANESEMLEYMSKMCGEAEYVKLQTNSNMNNVTQDTLLDSVIKKRNVLPDEFRSLKNMTAYLKIAGHNPTKINIEYLALPAINDADCSKIPNFYKKENSDINQKSMKPMSNQFDINKIKL